MLQNYSHLKNSFFKSNYRASLAVGRIFCVRCPTERFYRRHFGLFSRGSTAKLSFPNRLPNDLLKKCDAQFARLLARRFGNERNKKFPNEVPNKTHHHIFLIVAAFILYLYFGFKNKINSFSRVTWPIFVQDILSKGKVDKIIIFPGSETVVIYVKEGVTINSNQEHSRIYYMNVTDSETFENDLREEEARLGISPSDGVVLVYARPSILLNVLLVLIPVAVVIILFRFFNKMITGMNPFANFSRAKFTLIDPLTGYGKGVRISDVAGLKEAKQEVMEFVDYLKRPEHYKNLGAKVPKGALLLGPPGCGKTLLAKAVATEANVPFLSMNGSEFVELIGGLGAARVRDLFSEARKRSPCIIYVDEIDTIGKKRAESSVIDGSQSEGEHTLNQLLVEMDGMASRDGVVMLASTNRAEILDKALLRPGRFDRHILIDFPTLDERKEIFMQHLKSIHLEHRPEYYVKRMASLTPGFSGADIANICNEAALHAARYKKRVVKGEDLEYAVERVVGGTEKRSSAIGPEEKRMVAYHEAGRALVGWVSESGEVLLKISVVPRTHLSVGWVQFTPLDQFLFSQNELFDKMCVALGGRVAESLIFNKISTKAQKDLQKITRIAYAQVRQYGMNEIVGLVSFGDVAEHQMKPYSKQLGALIDEEARKLIARAYRETESILLANKDKLVKLAEELLKRETLNYADVVALIGPPKNERKKMVEPLEFDLALERAAGPDPQPKEEQAPRRSELQERNEGDVPFCVAFPRRGRLGSVPRKRHAYEWIIY